MLRASSAPLGTGGPERFPHARQSFIESFVAVSGMGNCTKRAKPWAPDAAGLECRDFGQLGMGESPGTAWAMCMGKLCTLLTEERHNTLKRKSLKQLEILFRTE